jgi:hypothetical protein
MKFLSRTYPVSRVILISLFAFFCNLFCFLANVFAHYRLAPFLGHWLDYFYFVFQFVLFAVSFLIWMRTRLDLWLRIMLTVLFFLVFGFITCVWMSLIEGVLGGLMF